MRRYASTYLSTSTLQMEIPEQIYHLGGYGRSQKLTVSIARLTRDDQIVLDRCDRFSLHLVPFRPKDLKQLFFVTVAIQSRPNTLAQVLDFFKTHQIDILECRSVDRRLPAGGLVELIISVEKKLLEGVDPGKHPQVLKEKLLNHLGYVREEPLIGDALIDLAVSVWSRISTLVGHPEIHNLKSELTSYSGDSSTPLKEKAILQQIARMIQDIPLSQVFQPQGSDNEIQEIRREIRQAFRRVTAGPQGRLEATGEIPRWVRGEGAVAGEANSRVLQKDENLWNSISIVKPLPEESIEHLTGTPNPQEYYHIEKDVGKFIEHTGFALKLDQEGADPSIIEKLRQCPHHNYVSLIFDDRANLLQAIFKDPSEIIVRFLTLLENIPGQLERVVSPLGKMGVDLRLINPLLPAQIPEEWNERENHNPYEIIANIDNTKLRLFDRRSMLSIVQAEIFNGTSRESTPRDIPFIRIEEIKMNEEKLGKISLDILSSSLLERQFLRYEMPLAPEDNSGTANGASWMLIPSNDAADGSFDIRFLSAPLFRNTTTALLHLQVRVPKEVVGSHSFLQRDSLLELLRNVFEFQLNALKDEQLLEEEYPRRLGNEFLAAASDAIHSVNLVASCDALCLRIESMSNGTNVSDVKKKIGPTLTVGFRDLKFGLLPLLESRKLIYVAEPGQGQIRFRREDDLTRCRQGINSLLEGLENFVKPINDKNKMPEAQVFNALKSAAAEIQNILHPPEPDKPVPERINEQRALRERTRSQ